MNTPKMGDRVRVSFDGVISHVSSTAPKGLRVDLDDGTAYWIESYRNVSIEVLLPPEPEWQPGDVVRDPCGLVYVRAVRCWQCIDGRTYHDGTARVPPRPLTRLVPES